MAHGGRGMVVVEKATSTNEDGDGGCCCSSPFMKFLPETRKKRTVKR